MKRKLTLTLALLVVSLGLCIVTNAQKGKLFKGVDWVKTVEAAKNGNVNIDKEVIARVEAAYAEEAEDTTASFLTRLTGTWYVTVPGATPAETFYAYQTFGEDGTFVETSSLLITLTEGPAHGVWQSRRNGAVYTFELFAFDPEEGVQVGRVRVRNFARMSDNNHILVDSAVDFIELDGTVIPNIATGHYTGERVQLRGL
ncbi:hypothetical protein BH10ACI1_BH10ACI1_27520 [soil metagenome]